MQRVRRTVVEFTRRQTLSGEIAASGSSPGVCGRAAPCGNTSEASRERLSARLSAARACDSFSRSNGPAGLD
jgi:hypothetical protein